MGSCKIQNMLNTFLFQNGRSRTQIESDQNPKANWNQVNRSVSSVWDLRSYGLQGLWAVSLLCCAVCSMHNLPRRLLKPSCSLGGHPMILASPMSWHPKRLHLLHGLDSNSGTRCQASTSLHDLFSSTASVVRKPPL